MIDEVRNQGLGLKLVGKQTITFLFVDYHRIIRGPDSKERGNAITSLSIPIDSREPCSPGNKCAARADSGKEGKFYVVVCVLVMIISPCYKKKTAASERAMKWSVVQLSALIEWVENKEADLFGRL